MEGEAEGRRGQNSWQGKEREAEMVGEGKKTDQVVESKVDGRGKKGKKEQSSGEGAGGVAGCQSPARRHTIPFRHLRHYPAIISAAAPLPIDFLYSPVRVHLSGSPARILPIGGFNEGEGHRKGLTHLSSFTYPGLFSERCG